MNKKSAVSRRAFLGKMTAATAVAAMPGYGRPQITNASHLVVFAGKKNFSEADVDAFISTHSFLYSWWMGLKKRLTYS